MSSFGLRLAVIDKVIGDSASDASMSGPDYDLLAERLSRAIQQVQILKLCAEPTTVTRPSRPSLKLKEVA